MKPARRFTVRGALAGIRTAATRTASARVAYHYASDVRAALNAVMTHLGRAEWWALEAKKRAAAKAERRREQRQRRAA